MTLAINIIDGYGFNNEVHCEFPPKVMLYVLAIYFTAKGNLPVVHYYKMG